VREFEACRAYLDAPRASPCWKARAEAGRGASTPTADPQAREAAQPSLRRPRGGDLRLDAIRAKDRPRPRRDRRNPWRSRAAHDDRGNRPRHKAHTRRTQLCARPDTPGGTNPMRRAMSASPRERLKRRGSLMRSILTSLCRALKRASSGARTSSPNQARLVTVSVNDHNGLLP
jgi:hypothetical protein